MSIVLFLEESKLLIGPTESNTYLNVHLNEYNLYIYEDLVKFTLIFKTDLVRKGLNMRFGG